MLAPQRTMWVLALLHTASDGVTCVPFHVAAAAARGVPTAANREGGTRQARAPGGQATRSTTLGPDIHHAAPDPGRCGGLWCVGPMAHGARLQWTGFEVVP